MKRIAFVTVLLLAAAALAGVARPEGADAQQPSGQEARTVTVTGTGSVSSVPDRAEVSFGVESRADTAKAALAANAAEMRKVIDALRRAGARDIRTQWVSVAPRVVESGAIAGFTASNSVSATTDVAKAGALVDTAVAAGANQVYGPSLSTGDAESLYRQALKAAVGQARERAEVLAAAAGAKVGAVTAIVEGGGGPIAYAKTASVAAEATPIEPGQQQTTATVAVTFALA